MPTKIGHQAKGPMGLTLTTLLILALGWGLAAFYQLPEVRQVRASFAASDIEVAAIWYADLDAYREIRLKRGQLP